MKTTSLAMALCLQMALALLAGNLGVRAEVALDNQTADNLAFYETHMSPMGWGAVLARSGTDAVSSLSSTGKAITSLSPKWKAGWDPSTYNSEDRAAERAYLKPHTHITIKRPAGNWTTSKTKAARAYNNMRLRYRNPIYNSVRPGPAKFYMPGTIKQLIQTIKRLNKAGTRWVVRGGGHNYEATALPSGTGAAVIDMARFTQFRIASDAQSAIIGAGQRLGEVYLRLAQHNPPLLMVAGTCAANGASGYLLGGGAGVSSRKYGWGTEQVTFARAVLADGTLAVASANPADALPGQPVSAPDLLWALRGGGAGTAVVYEWTVAVYPAPGTVTECDQEYSVPTLSDYQAFTNQLFATWNPAATLSGSLYPHIRYYLFKNKDDGRRLARFVLTGWDVDAQVVNATIIAGMAPLASEAGRCRIFPSWLEYIRFFAIEEYYGAAKAQAVTPANFTIRYQLSVDYLGWPGGQPVPLTPYGKFEAANPPPSQGGPSPFKAQGIFSYGPWSSAASAAIYNLLDVNVFSAGYVLGGALAGPAGAAATDGVGSAAQSAWQGATSMLLTDVPASNVVANAATIAAGQVLDADPAPADVGKRFYNFLNCYAPASDSTLFNLYYGDTATRLVWIKQAAGAMGMMTTWCGW